MPPVGHLIEPETVEPSAEGVTPFWTTGDGESVKLYCGDVLAVLPRLPAESVHCVVTSPPYWGLRDYGTGEWEGGDEECSHRPSATGGNPKQGPNKGNNGGKVSSPPDPVCRMCGAVRVADDQLGSEARPDCGIGGSGKCGECHVCRIVAVFREVRRVLRDDGTLWLNYGDSYGQNGGKGFDTNGSGPENRKSSYAGRNFPTSLPSGNLVGVPWRVAFALQADGWILRQDIIWHKPSPMPESVRNRCTKAHEYLFLLTKGMKYYYDAEPLREKSEYGPGTTWADRRTVGAGDETNAVNSRRHTHGNGKLDHNITPLDGRANKRSVWSVSSQGYPGAHFATFPPKLIEPCVLAGTSEKGCCASCGAPWRRVVEEETVYRNRPNAHVKYEGQGPNGQPDQTKAGLNSRTVGWEPSCDCGEGVGVIPCTVLDPFIGSGTTAEVALKAGRRCVGIDLSEKYLRENAFPRVRDVLATDTRIEKRVGSFDYPK